MNGGYKFAVNIEKLIIAFSYRTVVSGDNMHPFIAVKISFSYAIIFHITATYIEFDGSVRTECPV